MTTRPAQRSAAEHHLHQLGTAPRHREAVWSNEIPLAIYCLEKALAKITEEKTATNGNGRIEEEVVM